MSETNQHNINIGYEIVSKTHPLSDKQILDLVKSLKYTYDSSLVYFMLTQKKIQDEIIFDALIIAVNH